MLRINFTPKTKSLNSSLSGFTVVELVVVIVVIGILAGIVTYAYTGSRIKAKDSQREADIMTIKHQIDKWAEENGTFPRQGSSAGAIETNFAVTGIGIPRDALINPDAPSGTTNSISSNAVGGNLNYTNYGYRSFTSGGGACTLANATCVGYKLYYFKQSTGQRVTVPGGTCTTATSDTSC